MSRATCFIVVFALLAACERPGYNPDETRHRAGQALSDTLAYPRSSMLSVSSPDSVTTVATWFLKALPLNHWDVKRNVSDRSGTVTIYAEQNKRPLWLTLRPNVGGPGTTYTMIGVIPTDSTKR